MELSFCACLIRRLGFGNSRSLVKGGRKRQKDPPRGGVVNEDEALGDDVQMTVRAGVGGQKDPEVGSPLQGRIRGQNLLVRWSSHNVTIGL